MAAVARAGAGPDHRRDDPGRHLGREQGVPAGDRTDRVDELLGVGVLEQEAARPGPQGVEEVVVAVEGREHDDPAEVRRDDRPGRLDAVHHRHLHVHEDDVGCELARRGDGRARRSATSPTTSMSSSTDSIIVKPDRTRCWSSTMSTRIGLTATQTSATSLSPNGIRTRTR